MQAVHVYAQCHVCSDKVMKSVKVFTWVSYMSSLLSATTNYTYMYSVCCVNLSPLNK